MIVEILGKQYGEQFYNNLLKIKTDRDQLTLAKDKAKTVSGLAILKLQHSKTNHIKTPTVSVIIQICLKRGIRPIQKNS